MKERIKMEKIIKLENVSLAKQGQTILKNLNWQVNKGEHWAILGLNGSGKSTLLRLLMAEHWKTQGKVTVLGTEFGAGDIPQLRTKIGVVGSFIAERLPSHLIAEEIVLTGKYKSSILYAAYGQTELNQAREMMTSIGGQDLIGRSYASLSQGDNNQIDKKVYPSQLLSEVTPNELLGSFEEKAWDNLPKEESGQISRYFNAELNQKYNQGDTHTSRVREHILKLLNFNHIKSL